MKTEKSDTSHNDQDSDVSFEIDNDEEIDAAEIEEEEWVEYIKRSSIEALEKMKNEKMLEDDSKKNEMEIGDENRNMNGIPNSAQNTGPTERLEGQGKDGKMTSTNSSNKLKTRLKI